MSCGVGRRRGSDPELLWLWRRPAATALIGPLAWEPPYAAGAAQEMAKKTKKKKPSRRPNSPRLQAVLQSHSHQDNVVLDPKQKDRPMEQNRERRNKPRHPQSINLQQSRQDYKMGKRQFLQQVVLGKLDSCM